MILGVLLSYWAAFCSGSNSTCFGETPQEAVLLQLGLRDASPFFCCRRVSSLECSDCTELRSEWLPLAFQYVTILAACHQKVHPLKCFHIVPCHYEVSLSHKLVCLTSLWIIISPHSTTRLGIVSAGASQVTVAQYGHATSIPHRNLWTSKSVASEK